MATVSSLGITFNTNAGNKTVTATPALGDLIVVIAANTGRTTAQPPTITDNNTDGHGTYVRLSTAATKATSADSMWIFIRADSVQKAVSTVFTMATSGDSGGGLQVFKVTGMSIVGPAVARAAGKVDNQGAVAPAPAFPQAGLTGNACIGAVFNATNVAGIQEPSGWSESQDTGYNVPATGLETAFRSSGNTNTTITWQTASPSACCAIIVELDATVPTVLPENPALQSVNRTVVW